jgi:hypothetical protein
MSNEEEPIEAEDSSLAERLIRDRPVPTATFRGALGRHLAARDPGFGPRPERLWAMVVGYLVIGGLLILLGLLQATGVL